MLLPDETLDQVRISGSNKVFTSATVMLLVRFGMVIHLKFHQ